MLLCFAVAFGTCHSQEILVVNDGNSEYCIVVASQAVHEESAAASELQKYLKQAMGAELPVVKSDTLSESRCLVVGRRDAKLVNR